MVDVVGIATERGVEDSALSEYQEEMLTQFDQTLYSSKVFKGNSRLVFSCGCMSQLWLIQKNKGAGTDS